MTLVTLMILLPITIAIALTVGYFYGKNHVDPHTKFGKEYYDKDPWDYT